MKSPRFPTSNDPCVLLLFNEAAAFIVAATRASFIVIFIFTHARFITNGKERQWALGLKSLPKATGTFPSIIFLAGGGVILKMYAVDGSKTANVGFF